MTTVLIGISVVLGALVVLLLALLVIRWRSGNSTDERVAEVVASLNARMDELGRELAGALERAEEEGRRSRIFGELAGSIDLDEVLSRTLEAAGALEHADAALVMLPDPNRGEAARRNAGPVRRGGGAARHHRAAGRPARPLDHDVLYLSRARAGVLRRGRCDQRRARGAASGRQLHSRLPDGVHAPEGTRVRRRRRAPARDARPAGRARRSRTRGASARRASSQTSMR